MGVAGQFRGWQFAAYSVYPLFLNQFKSLVFMFSIISRNPFFKDIRIYSANIQLKHVCF